MVEIEPTFPQVSEAAWPLVVARTGGAYRFVAIRC